MSEDTSSRSSGVVDWLHVISDPIVVRVFAGSTDEEREAFKASLIDSIRTDFGLTLTCAPDSLTLSRSQVNVPVLAMSEALYSLGARLCRVSFFGMKWSIPSAEPVIDRFIQRYRDQMGSAVLTGRNLFDYRIRFPTDGVLLFGLSDEQRRIHMYRDGSVHDMCNEHGFGSFECRPLLDLRLSKVKIYQELVHDILSTIPRRMLDDMPTTIRTIRTRAGQLQDLLQRWMDMTYDMRISRVGGVRIELTVETESVVDGRRLCSEHDLFSMRGLERALGGAFDTREIAMDTHLESCLEFLTGLAVAVSGRNERAPSVEIQSILTFARQAFGWSGRYMDRQLQQARDWAAVAEAAEAAMDEDGEDLGFSYRGVELDAPEVRPLIQDFLDHAEWTLQSRVRDRTVPGLMLRTTYAGRFLPKTGIYTDRVGAARHYIGMYGAAWRHHIRSIA